jgi:hypothetical protein
MKRGRADVDGEDEEEMDSNCNSTDNDAGHEPAWKKQKQQPRQPDTLSVNAQTQVLECDDLVCCIMTVCNVCISFDIYVCTMHTHCLFIFTQYMDAGSKVRQLPLVCNTWNRACHNPVSWHSIRVDESRDIVDGVRDFKAVEQLMPRLSRVEVLWCQYESSYHGIFEMMITLYSPRLRDLNMHCIDDDKLLTIVMSATNLHSIHLHHMVSAPGVANALCFLRQLKHINVRSPQLLPGLYDIGSTCPLLETYTGHIDAHIITSLASCQHLTKLDVFRGIPGLTNALSGLLRTVGHNLQWVEFPYCDGSDVLPLIGQHCGKIQRLGIPYMYKVTDGLMDEALSGCGSTLRDLYLTPECTDATLISVAAHCPNLIHFDTTINDHFTDSGMAVFIASCPNLRHLNLCMRAVACHPALQRVSGFIWASDKKLNSIHTERAELGLRPVILERRE